MINAIRIDEKDNVAMVTASVEAGHKIFVKENGQILTALEPITAGHKVALVRLDAGENAIKYGIPIGRMMSPVDAGGWISVHNLKDTTAELCGEYCRQFRAGERTIKEFPPESDNYAIRKIKAFPRKNGTFGIRNYVMVISTTPEANFYAETISDKTGCSWFVCDKTRLESEKITDYTKNGMINIGRHPNNYAIVVLGSDSGVSNSREIFDKIAETGKPVEYLSISDNDIVSKGEEIVASYQKDASALKRELVSMEGFGLSVHCSGSDWTTAINGNYAVGAASDLIVKNGGRVFMTEIMEWSGSQHLLAEQCATYELGLKLLDVVDSVRATVLRETGRPVEYMNPAPGNKEAGLTTLVEKSTGTIRKIGTTPIQGILEFCEQPTGKGVWIPRHDSVWPPTTATYSSMTGAQMSILNTGLGMLYFEMPHMPCVRSTGNSETFATEEYKLDFNAGIALEGKTIPEVGEMLFEYLIRIAEGEEEPKTEIGKVRAYNLYYYTEDEFGADIDRSRVLPVKVYDYQSDYKRLTDLVK